MPWTQLVCNSYSTGGQRVMAIINKTCPRATSLESVSLFTHINTWHCAITTTWLPGNKVCSICSPLYVAPCFLMKSEGTIGKLAKSSLFASSKVDGCTSKKWKQSVVNVASNPDSPAISFLYGERSGLEVWFVYISTCTQASYGKLQNRVVWKPCL